MNRQTFDQNIQAYQAQRQLDCEHAVLVASELNKMGFVANRVGTQVFVKLNSRNISQQEVATALEQAGLPELPIYWYCGGRKIDCRG